MSRDVSNVRQVGLITFYIWWFFVKNVMIVIRKPGRMKIYTCIHLLNIGGYLVDAGSYKLDSDPFMKVSLSRICQMFLQSKLMPLFQQSLSTYDRSDWNPGVYVNDHTAVLVENSQRKIDTLEPRLWDEFNTGVNYYNTSTKVRLLDIPGDDFQFPNFPTNWSNVTHLFVQCHL